MAVRNRSPLSADDYDSTSFSLLLLSSSLSSLSGSEGEDTVDINTSVKRSAVGKKVPRIKHKEVDDNIVQVAILSPFSDLIAKLYET
ncbi:hypothetical protein BGX26_004038, partial [Mortierella sp. AD094]